MTPGERWKASKHFVWAPGMVDDHGIRVLSDPEGEEVFASTYDHAGDIPLAHMGVPDLDDPATFGCLYAQLRTVVGEFILYPKTPPRQAICRVVGDLGRSCQAATLADAMLDVLDGEP